MTVAHRRLLWGLVVAMVWLAALTSINAILEIKIRGILLFALPVAWVAWRSLVVGFVVAGLGTLGGLIGGAIPHPESHEPIYIEGLLAFLKLSVVAIWAFLASRVVDKNSLER